MSNNIGLIGLGDWGMKIVKTLKNNFPNYKITSIAVKKGKNVKNLNCKLKIYKNWKNMIKQEKFKFLFCAVPPSNNLSIFKEAIKNKIPLFLEKPMTDSLKSAYKMYDYISRKKGNVHINFIDLYNPAIIFLRKKSEKFYKIDFQISNSYKAKPYMTPFEDLAPHAIAICLSFFKKFPYAIEVKSLPISVKVKGKKNRQLIRLKLIFSKKEMANIIVGNGTFNKIRKGKFYSRNKIYYYNDMIKTKLSKLDREKKTNHNINLKNITPLASSIKEFIKNHKKNKENEVKLGLNIQKIVDQTLTSLRKGKQLSIL